MARFDRDALVKSAPREQVFVTRADRRDPIPTSDYFGTPVRGIESRGANAPTSFFDACAFYGSRVQSIGFNRPRGAIRSYGSPTVSKILVKAIVVMAFAGAMAMNAPFVHAQEAATSAHQGAYEQLAPGGQKIAKALYDAQITSDDIASSGNSTNGSGEASAISPPVFRFTLDDIAAMKRDGRGWGQVFRELYGHGVIQERNLGQVVSNANHALPASPDPAVVHVHRPAPTVITYADGNSYTVHSPGVGRHNSHAVAGGPGGRHEPTPRVVPGAGRPAAALATAPSLGAANGHGVHGGGRPAGKAK